ncbi:hypothetical protein CUP1712 [Campylobacter upsaliensis RM3195]|nr:hypothetical protein CUP1712 [Campylobacter upsaliensis RM3195]
MHKEKNHKQYENNRPSPRIKKSIKFFKKIHSDP